MHSTNSRHFYIACRRRTRNGRERLAGKCSECLPSFRHGLDNPLSRHDAEVMVWQERIHAPSLRCAVDKHDCARFCDCHFATRQNSLRPIHLYRGIGRGNEFDSKWNPVRGEFRGNEQSGLVDGSHCRTHGLRNAFLFRKLDYLGIIVCESILQNTDSRIVCQQAALPICARDPRIVRNCGANR